MCSVLFIEGIARKNIVWMAANADRVLKEKMAKVIRLASLASAALAAMIKEYVITIIWQKESAKLIAQNSIVFLLNIASGVILYMVISA